ncbi:hypothetical protein [Serratia grimesii]|uniref:hypothetical protein n=2 Tax=Serratia grimesii TaxID=82995 RepID=UPI00224458CC|nr:hypothetical protein [Serratia grimesii]
MISFTDSDVREKIIQVNEYLAGALDNEAKRIKSNLTANGWRYKDIGESDLVLYVINYAWNDFYIKFKKDNTSGVELDKLTLMNRREFIDDDPPFSKKEYVVDDKMFLITLLRIMYEIDFYNPDIRSTRSYLKDDVLDALVMHDPEDIYGFKWVRDRMAISITRFVLNSDGAKKLMENLADFSTKEKIFNLSIDAAVERGEKIIQLKENELLSRIEVIERSASELMDGTQRNIAIKIEETKEEIRTDIALGKVEIIEMIHGVKKLAENVASSKEGIEDIEKRLKGYHSEYNFVGLYDGFKKLKNDKDTELESINDSYHIAMIVAIILPLATIGAHILYPDLVKGKGWVEWLSWGGPFAAIEALILYYARVMYSEIKSIKTQLVQINLRGSLCQFIEEYMNYRQRIKGDAEEINDSALEKFDSVIFSAIQMDSDNIPGAFDGVNAIAELAGKVIAKGRP